MRRSLSDLVANVPVDAGHVSGAAAPVVKADSSSQPVLPFRSHKFGGQKAAPQENSGLQSLSV
jgi:hypothetical protein